MATTLTDANRAAHEARDRGTDRLDQTTLRKIRNHYLGALARGDTDNQGEHTKLADKARTLIARFRRFEDMILRFATDLSVPFTNNEAEVRHEVARDEWLCRWEVQRMLLVA